MPSERKVVLLVDDDSDFLAELQEALALSGYVPVPVSGGYDAVRLARRIKPDVILLDLKLGAESGLEVAARIRKQHGTSRIPVIMMSGYFSEAARAHALRPSNINVYLNKPFSQRDVVRGIQLALDTRKEKKPGVKPKVFLLDSI